jgi:hypothetical protein
MPVLEVQGETAVARLLRDLADEIERGSADVDGRHVDVSALLRAVVEFPDDSEGEITLLDIHLEHPTPKNWALTELMRSLAHPGD